MEKMTHQNMLDAFDTDIENLADARNKNVSAINWWFNVYSLLGCVSKLNYTGTLTDKESECIINAISVLPFDSMAAYQQSLKEN